MEVKELFRYLLHFSFHLIALSSVMIMIKENHLVTIFIKV